MAPARAVTERRPAVETRLLTIALVLFSACLGAVVGEPHRAWAWNGLLLFGTTGVLLLRERRSPRAPPEARFQVTFDAETIAASHPRRPLERVRWRDVVQVSIATTSGGPLLPDLFFVLHDRRGVGVAFPQGAVGAAPVVTALLELPGFDHDAFMAAVGSTGEALFPCWRGDGIAPTALPRAA